MMRSSQSSTIGVGGRRRAKSKSPERKKEAIIDPFMLIRNGDLQELKSKLELGQISLHQTRWSGFTLLHRASEIGHTELCDFLIQAGISVNVVSARGWQTPLHLAVGNGYMDTANLLISKGALPWKRNKYNQDPFEYGSRRGFTKLSEELKNKMIKIETQRSIERHMNLASTSSSSVSRSNSPQHKNNPSKKSTT